MVQQIVYNSCVGGFAVHIDVTDWVRENKSRLVTQYDPEHVDELADLTLPGELYPDGSGPMPESHDTTNGSRLSRDNELLADIVTAETAYRGTVSGDYSALRVAEVPDGADWTITVDDGKETVVEQSRTFSGS